VHYNIPNLTFTLLYFTAVSHYTKPHYMIKILVECQLQKKIKLVSIINESIKCDESEQHKFYFTQYDTKLIL